MENLYIPGLTLPALKQVEALLVMMGFHPAGIDRAAINTGGHILLHPDRLFCVCCGFKIDRLAWRTNTYKCQTCVRGNCRHLTPEEYLDHHNKLGLIIQAVTHP